MGSKWLWIMMSVLILELAGLSYGCLEQERTALLQLKPFLADYWYLSNWKEEEGSDCCLWKSVECNLTTRRVTKLSLGGSNMKGEERYLNILSLGGSNMKGEERYLNILSLGGSNMKGDGWYLNASLFLPFEELRSLVLVGNEIVGCVENEGFGKLSKLRHLEMVDLSYNYFNDSTLSSLTKISSLKSLNLAGNSLTGSNHPDDHIKWLSRLSDLETLDLSDIELKNSFLLHLGGLSSLRTLILSGTELKGVVHIQGNGRQQKLINLEEINLSDNLFNNSILAHLDLSGFPNLKSLNIGKNQMNGSIDIKGITNFYNFNAI
ncbi:hypothetical protein REPUB_Repub15cG0125600 [Reevesia pubescens]